MDQVEKVPLLVLEELTLTFEHGDVGLSGYDPLQNLFLLHVRHLFNFIVFLLLLSV
jgi:hypothetical protein